MGEDIQGGKEKEEKLLGRGEKEGNWIQLRECAKARQMMKGIGTLIWHHAFSDSQKSTKTGYP